MTSLFSVYEAFLARITADEWTLEEEFAMVERDWRQFLDIAIFRFKFPRTSLEYIVIDENETGTDNSFFTEDLNQDEIQLLALFMKHEWVKRCVASWENIRQLYADKEFSQANHLAQLIKLEASVAEEVRKAEGIYDRVWNKRPSKRFSQLAGKNHR